HQYKDNPTGQPTGSYTISVTVTDKDGGTTSGSTSEQVNNVAPTANANGPYSGTAGTAISFKGTATDPSSADTAAGFTYAWNFGDSSTGSGATPNHTYATAGTYTVTLTATDKDGGASSVTTTATVSAAPTPPVANAGPALVANEGAAVTFSGSVTGGTAPLSYAWNFGDGATASGRLTPTHTYADNGAYTATLTVTDALGKTSQSSTSVTVNNVAPASLQLTLTATSINENGSVSLGGSFTDPGTKDTHQVVVNWG